MKMILRLADQNLVDHLKDLVILYCTLPWLKLERMIGGGGGESMQKAKAEVRENEWRKGGGGEGKYAKDQGWS